MVGLQKRVTVTEIEETHSRLSLIDTKFKTGIDYWNSDLNFEGFYLSITVTDRIS